MNILVIGGSGFVGHAIVRALLAEGRSLSLLNRGSRPIAGTVQLTADRNDPSALASALGDRRFDAVVDTNCYTPQQAGMLVEALGGRVATAVVITSVAVYADNVRQPPTETEPTGGAAAWADYGRGKTEVEHVYAAAGFCCRDGPASSLYLRAEQQSRPGNLVFPPDPRRPARARAGIRGRLVPVRA